MPVGDWFQNGNLQGLTLSRLDIASWYEKGNCANLLSRWWCILWETYIQHHHVIMRRLGPGDLISRGNFYKEFAQISFFSSLVLRNLTKYMDFQNNHSFCTAWSREGFEEHHASPFYILSSWIFVWGSLECVASTFDIVLHQPLRWKQWMIFWKGAIFVCEVFVFKATQGSQETVLEFILTNQRP